MQPSVRHITAFVTLVVLIGCGESPLGSDTFNAGALPDDTACLAVSTAEFGTSGAVSWLNTDTGEVNRGVTTTHHDASLRRAGNDLVVLNRLGADNLQWLDPNQALRTRQQLALPAGSNPWDYVQRGDRAIVAGYGRGELFVLERTSGVWALNATVSLRDWADVDGNAEPARLLLQGDTLLVLLQRLEGFTCGNTGAVLALDWSTLAPANRFAGSPTVDLGVCNPTAFVLGEDGDLYVSAAGVFRAVAPSFGVPVEDDGGVVRVTRSSGATELLFSESDFDADPLSIERGPAGSLWILLSDAEAAVSVHRLNGGPPLADSLAEGQSIFDVEVQATYIWVADRSVTRPGLRAVAHDGTTLVDVVDVGLPPVELLPFACP
jgi:hypothetical protein